MKKLIDIIPLTEAPHEPGAIVSVVVPGRWLLWLSPDHPAYPDLLLEQLREWPVSDLIDFSNRDGMPHITREYAKAEIERRKHL